MERLEEDVTTASWRIQRKVCSRRAVLKGGPRVRRCVFPPPCRFPLYVTTCSMSHVSVFFAVREFSIVGTLIQRSRRYVLND
jgi:hypothetical protein